MAKLLPCFCRIECINVSTFKVYCLPAAKFQCFDIMEGLPRNPNSMKWSIYADHVKVATIMVDVWCHGGDKALDNSIESRIG